MAARGGAAEAAAAAEPWAFEAFDGAEGDLFDDAEEVAWAAAAAVPTVQVAPVAPKPRPPPPPSLPPAGEPSRQQPARAASLDLGAGEASAPTSAPADASASLPPHAAHSLSLSTRVLSLGKAAQGLLPRALRRFLTPAEGDSDGASDAAPLAAGVPEDEAEREQLRRELLLGHLLSLAAGGAPAVPAHTLPAVASSLQRGGLLPRWLAWALTKQPALFDRAFKRIFAAELAAAHAAGAAAGDPTAAWALDRFWRRPPAGAGAGAPAPGPGAGGHTGGGAAALPASRYETDFSELRQLGRGAFGVVSLAINRFDGRQYALKRITLSAHSPAAFARIMREVATLSRLQHPHVVRYFQAW
jgi:translation initiation factor 2-alpha kinase 4